MPHAATAARHPPTAAELEGIPLDEREAVIEVENLVTHFGDRKILKDVTLSLRQVEILFIMGGSGSG